MCYLMLRNKNKCTLEEDLIRSKKIWDKKKVLQLVYHSWYNKIRPYIKKGTTVEFSCGIGNFKEYYKKCYSSDIRYYPWEDFTADALNMPIKSNSVDNIVVVDGLHHFPRPYEFIKEAQRTLKKNGRLLLIEPYISPFSYIIRKIFHHEEINMKSLITTDKPTEANLAIPTLMFRNREKFHDKFKNLKIMKINYMDKISYLLSGGFNHKSIINEKDLKFFSKIENIFSPLNRLLGFKMTIIIRKN